MDKGLREVIEVANEWFQVVFSAGGVLIGAVVDTVLLPIRLLLALLS